MGCPRAVGNKVTGAGNLTHAADWPAVRDNSLLVPWSAVRISAPAIELPGVRHTWSDRVGGKSLCGTAAGIDASGDTIELVQPTLGCIITRYKQLQTPCSKKDVKIWVTRHTVTTCPATTDGKEDDGSLNSNGNDPTGIQPIAINEELNIIKKMPERLENQENIFHIAKETANADEYECVKAAIQLHSRVLAVPSSRSVNRTALAQRKNGLRQAISSVSPLPAPSSWGATVAERLARSPPTKVNRAQSPAGSLDFRKWESCRTMPLVGGFSRGWTAVTHKVSEHKYGCQSHFTAIDVGSYARANGDEAFALSNNILRHYPNTNQKLNNVFTTIGYPVYEEWWNVLSQENERERDKKRLYSLHPPTKQHLRIPKDYQRRAANPSRGHPPPINLKGMCTMEVSRYHWLGSSPPITANRVQYLAEPLPDFGNRVFVKDDIAGRWIFSAISHFPSPCNSGAAPYSPYITLIGCDPGSIPGRATPDFRMYVGRQVFSGSPVSPALFLWRCSKPTSIHFTGSQDLDVKSRPNLFTHANPHELISRPSYATVQSIEHRTLHSAKTKYYGRTAKHGSDMVDTATHRCKHREDLAALVSTAENQTISLLTDCNESVKFRLQPTLTTYNTSNRSRLPRPTLCDQLTSRDSVRRPMWSTDSAGTVQDGGWKQDGRQFICMNITKPPQCWILDPQAPSPYQCDLSIVQQISYCSLDISKMFSLTPLSLYVEVMGKNSAKLGRVGNFNCGADCGVNCGAKCGARYGVFVVCGACGVNCGAYGAIAETVGNMEHIVVPIAVLIVVLIAVTIAVLGLN
ncbi:hypothetical protein PR048_005772 [Dryococelus australis]|uniref:Kringle domain-containing protein n=1 Tax=Dryococelus australis TaxID=614101 RepID=A0ABQ9I945_9NEOP|nr:hypothetical protein PR048_005772 [Dryococelus australis]